MWYTLRAYLSVSMSGEYISPVPPEQGGQTPQELNAELTSVLDLLPKVSLDDEAAAFEVSGVIQPVADAYFNDSYYSWLVKERRLHSGYGELVLDKITRLVGRANITEHFKQYILDMFTLWLEEGIYPDQAENVERTLFFLDRSRPGSGGIFDPERAASLDRRALEERGRLMLNIPPEELTLVIGEKRARNFYTTMKEWREQIKERYGDETL